MAARSFSPLCGSFHRGSAIHNPGPESVCSRRRHRRASRHGNHEAMGYPGGQPSQRGLEAPGLPDPKRHEAMGALACGSIRTWEDLGGCAIRAGRGLSGIPSGPNLSIMQVSVAPYPLPVNRLINVTVSTTDIGTGTNVAGDVVVDGAVIGPTNQAFTHEFKTRRVLSDPGPPRLFKTVYPKGVVRAQDYAAARNRLPGSIVVKRADIKR